MNAGLPYRGTVAPHKTNLALSMGAANTLRAPHVLPPRLSCDTLGMCQHTALDCGERCQREALDDGLVDVPLPALGGGNFWLDGGPDGAPYIDPRRDHTDPNGVTPDAQQPHLQAPYLMPVTMQPSWRDTGWYDVYYWTCIVAGYLATLALAGYVWGKWGDSAVRAFWRVVAGVS